MQNIGPQHGIDATRNRLILRDPEGATAYKKMMAPANPQAGLEGTMHKLVANSNELTGMNIANRLAALEDAVARGPFG